MKIQNNITMKQINKNSINYKIGEKIGFMVGLFIFCSILFYIITKAGGNIFNLLYSQFIITILVLYIVYHILSYMIKKAFK